jgi:hypothetical protein
MNRLHPSIADLLKDQGLAEQGPEKYLAKQQLQAQEIDLKYHSASSWLPIHTPPHGPLTGLGLIHKVFFN